MDDSAAFVDSTKERFFVDAHGNVYEQTLLPLEIRFNFKPVKLHFYLSLFSLAKNNNSVNNDDGFDP